MATAKKKATAGGKKPAAKATAPAEPSARQTETPATTQPPAKAPAAGRAVTPWGDIERLFDDLLERRLGLRWEWPSLRGWPGLQELRVPSIDVIDGKSEVVVRAEVPGIDKDDIDVSIVDRTLTIKGSTRHEEKKEEGDYHRHEIRSGTFSRQVALPADVDASKAKASFKNGVVELHLPKARASKRQKISVG